jgi:hypothetical protein
MKAIRLTRISEFNDATFGVLCIDNEPCFVTLEDLWRDNEKMVSCIPAGSYKLALNNSRRFGKTYQVCNVPNRDHILIHAGNTHKNTHGCILVGMQYGKLEKESAVLASKSAFMQFMTKMSDVSEADLLIVNAFGNGRLQ